MQLNDERDEAAKVIARLRARGIGVRVGGDGIQLIGIVTS
jgi:hypothetical protein